MKCNECEYAADYIDDSEENKKQCDITDEVHHEDFDCNCATQRQMYDKRNRLILEYETIKSQSTLSSTCIICGKTVDNEYGTTKVCYTCKEAIHFLSNNIHALDLIVREYEDTHPDTTEQLEPTEG